MRTLTLIDGHALAYRTYFALTGASVTTSRNHVHFAVTEHGIADLYGKTISQRAEALIAIAAPEFRGRLRQKAKELKYH